jgi:hypothetical protein
MRNHGLLRRFAPLRKRFAFVAGNDGAYACAKREMPGASSAKTRFALLPGHDVGNL